MSVATLTADGSILIPDRLREELHLKTGDRLQIEKHASGILVRPVSEPDLGRIPGLLRHRAPKQPLSVEEMEGALLDEAVAQLESSSGE